MKEIIKSVDELTAYAQEKLELNARDIHYKANRIMEILESGLSAPSQRTQYSANFLYCRPKWISVLRKS